MSTGVSEQRHKGPENKGKNVEIQSIPWSQQVDEAYFEGIATPNDFGTQGPSSAATQFQYPPFKSKDPKNASENFHAGRNRKNKKDECFQQIATISRKNENEIFGGPKNSVNFNRAMYTNENFKFNKNNLIYKCNKDMSKTNMERDFENFSIEYNGQKNTDKSCLKTFDQPYSQTKKNSVSSEASLSNVKQMTWASIASQPAKPVLRSNLTSSTLKKKGPGMPPPPMVPGKHNMDINIWETSKNGSALVPSMLPPVIPIPIAETLQHQQIVNCANEQGCLTSMEENVFITPKNNEKSDQFESQNKNKCGSIQIIKKYERNCQNQNKQGTPNEGNIRPPWVPQNQSLQTSNCHGNKNQSSSNYQSNPKNLNLSNKKGATISSVQDNSAGFSKSVNYMLEDSHETGKLFSHSTAINVSSLLTQDINQELRQKNKYNPHEMDIEKAKLARFFVIKSYSEDDIYRSIKYEIWCSTDRGNKRLDNAFQERQEEGGHVYLLFSVNGSGLFCGIAQMITNVDYNSVSNVWSQKKWKGTFKVKWLYVKDVPNQLLKHITIETNENKPVTKSRDTQEVPNDKGILMLKIIHKYKYETSLIDDFWHYEKRQEIEKETQNYDQRGNNKDQEGNRIHRSSSDFNRCGSYPNKQLNYQNYREKKNYNRNQNNFDDRRENKNLLESQKRENNSGDFYNNKSSSFRNYNQKEERNLDDFSYAVENCIPPGNFVNRRDSYVSSECYRERDQENLKRKGGWRSFQKSNEFNEKQEN